MGTDPEVLPEAISYFRYYFTGVLASSFYNACKSIMNALGDSRRPLYYLILSSSSTSPLDLLFIAGLPLGRMVSGGRYDDLAGYQHGALPGST